MELAQNALEDWEDKKLGDIALERSNTENSRYLSSEDFGEKQISYEVIYEKKILDNIKKIPKQ